MGDVMRRALWLAMTMLATPAAAGELGLAITTLDQGPSEDPAIDCPNGLTPSSHQIKMAALSPAAREEWQARDKRIGPNAMYLSQTLADFRDDTGTHACFAPTTVKDPPMFTGQSKKGYGMDLDGGDKTQHCPHVEFSGGIDNQVSRLTACVRGYQKGLETINRDRKNSIQNGNTVTLVHVTGVDDSRNDDDVTVAFYRSEDRLASDGTGAALPDATVGTDPNAMRFHATTKGKIVNGELLTEPVDLNLPVIGPAEHVMPHAIRGMRLRLAVAEDGYAKGLLSGYQDLETYYAWWARLNPNGRVNSYSCPALYQAMHDLADGYKDPATGKCTALSTALHITAVRVFIVPADQKAAAGN